MEDPVAQMEDERDPIDLSRLLAGAAKTIAKARYCSLATGAGAIGPSMRPMGRLPRDSGDSEWTFRFTPTAARVRRPTCGARARARSSFKMTPTTRSLR
jgi:hypothetical protein